MITAPLAETPPPAWLDPIPVTTVEGLLATGHPLAYAAAATLVIAPVVITVAVIGRVVELRDRREKEGKR